MLITSIASAIVAYVIAVVIRDEILSPYFRIIELFPDWISYPFGNCAKCFGGQIALWSYPFLFEWVWYNHLFYICLTILITHTLTILYERIENR